MTAFDNYQVNSKLVWDRQQSLWNWHGCWLAQILGAMKLPSNSTSIYRTWASMWHLSMVTKKTVRDSTKETIKYRVHNRTQHAKGFLQAPSARRVLLKLKTVTVGDRTTYIPLSPERTPFQTGNNQQSHLWKVPAKIWISVTDLMWVWGYSLLKISSLGTLRVLYGIRCLPRRPL
jgi:hypothetical protein